MKRPTQAVVLCGGLGTRLHPYTISTPKPMVDCNGKPFLWHLLTQISEQGIRDFLLLTGYLSQVIVDYFKDGYQFGWRIQYSDGPIGWDTGRRIWESRRLMHSNFLLLYSDNFSVFSLSKINLTHVRRNTSITLTVVKKSPGNIKIDNHGMVEKYDNNRSDTLKYVEIGYMIIERDRMFLSFTDKNSNFSEIIKNLVSQQECNVLIQHDNYYSISDPKRWGLTKKYLLDKKIILIDRDGVINKKAKKGCYITEWKNFEWIDDTIEAMKELSKCGFSFIIITNQAGIGRKLVTQNEVDYIHDNMLKFFTLSKIKILDIYTCPHHWEDDCACRKPKPGMLLKASMDHSFRLDRTVYIGDDFRDAEAAQNAGSTGIIIGKSVKELTMPEGVYYYPTLLQSVDFLKARLS